MTMRSHHHAVLQCACGAIQAQCRCLDKAKPRVVVTRVCPVCLPVQRTAEAMHTFVWDDPAPPRPGREVYGPVEHPEYAEVLDAPPLPPRRVLGRLGPVDLR